eukprot:gnl/MRDRNA2_/MRDRNA2_71940_c1_seq2.p1 gnl/MRDRNA2_/MRDRNA2_71940_c1~~gnl/MRDRNA2_/MRDRNA2_71940_c1_seq2.p1  ORF type:complete len:262 (+),score=79.01 gnl/MRDRNA2_/MRDRNA2_71940_c1_seq2:145-930(+)
MAERSRTPPRQVPGAQPVENHTTKRKDSGFDGSMPQTSPKDTDYISDLMACHDRLKAEVGDVKNVSYQAWSDLREQVGELHRALQGLANPNTMQKTVEDMVEKEAVQQAKHEGMLELEAEEMQRHLRRTSERLERVAAEAAEHRALAQEEHKSFESWVAEAEKENRALQDENQRLLEQRRQARSEERRDAEAVREQRASTEESISELQESRKKLELDNRRLCRDIESAKSVVRGLQHASAELRKGSDRARSNSKGPSTDAT